MTQPAAAQGLRRVSRSLRFFDDQSRYLDRFGWLLGIASTTLALAALLDSADARSGRVQEIGVLVMSFAGAGTMWLALSASGVSATWRLVIGVVVGVMLVVVTIEVVVGSIGGTDPLEHPRVSAPYLPVAYVLASFVAVVHRLLQHRKVTTATLLGAVTAYALIPLWFYYLFLVVNVWLPEPFYGQPEPTTQFMYASLTNVTTLGSTLEPSGPLPRLLTAAEAMIGQLFLVTFLALIVGLMATRWRGDSGD